MPTKSNTPQLARLALATSILLSSTFIGATLSNADEAPVNKTETSVSEAYQRHGEYTDPRGDGYPTAVKVEYVMGCLTANGMSLGNLTKCSCSIDYIAEQLDYEAYTKADTVLRAQLDQGTKGAVFRESNWAKEMVTGLQDLQAASTLECF